MRSHLHPLRIRNLLTASIALGSAGILFDASCANGSHDFDPGSGGGPGASAASSTAQTGGAAQSGSSVSSASASSSSVGPGGMGGGGGGGSGDMGGLGGEGAAPPTGCSAFETGASCDANGTTIYAIASSSVGGHFHFLSSDGCLNITDVNCNLSTSVWTSCPVANTTVTVTHMPCDGSPECDTTFVVTCQ